LAKRIYQKASEMGIKSKELIALLEKLGFESKTASSSFTGEMEKKLSEYQDKSVKKEKTESKEKQEKVKTGYTDTRNARREAILKSIGKASGQPVSPKKIVEVESGNQSEKTQPAAVPKTVELEVRPRKKKHIKLKPLRIIENMTAKQLADIIGISTREVLKTCMIFGVMATANQRLDLDVVEAVAEELGYFAILVTEEEFYAPPEPEKPAVVEPVEEVGVEGIKIEDEEIAAPDKEEKPEKGKPKKKKKAKKIAAPGEVKRAPVVTVMGHVDHGKTTLLDYIRNANVVAGEKGGITQHIGAYEVDTKYGRLTFVDTPGHEAFTAMRARGAMVTDIVILVVSQEDSLMPQTIEAINHARAADVPIIIAINKMDLPGASADKTKTDLAKHDILVEDLGGETLCTEISARKGDGVEHLLELITLQSEIMELVADPNGPAEGIVVESMLDKFRGATATLLVKKGTLKKGDSIVVGACPGRVRSMEDERGKRLKKAGPSTPVVITGMNGVPGAGEKFNVVADDSEAREIAEARQAELSTERASSREGITLESFFSMLEGCEMKELPIILKVDVDGSLEAIKGVVENLGNDEVGIKLVSVGVGSISESDVDLAQTTDSIIIGFNVKPDNRAKKEAQSKNIDIKLYNVIYELEADVRAALEGLLEPDIIEEQIGEVVVRQIFRIPRVGIVIGCYVQSGLVKRNTKVNIIRANEVIGEGQIDTLKRFKDDVKEVTEGYECGIEVSGFKNFKEGDTLEIFEVKKVTRRLEKK